MHVHLIPVSRLLGGSIWPSLGQSALHTVRSALPSLPSMPTRQGIIDALPSRPTAAGVAGTAKAAALGIGAALAIQTIGQALQVTSQLPEIEGGARRKSYLKRVLGKILTPQNLLIAPAIAATMYHVGSKIHKAAGH